MNFIVAILVVVAVGYLIVKKYYAQGVLLLGGLHFYWLLSFLMELLFLQKEEQGHFILMYLLN